MAGVRVLLCAAPLASSLRLGMGTRRSALAAGAALFGDIAATPAYDALPSAVPSAATAPDPEKLMRERAQKRKEREAIAAKKNAEVEKLLNVISAATDGKQYADATDELSLWIISQGAPLPPPGGPWADILQSSPLPEGFETRELIARCKAALKGLPRTAYSCEKTRDNGGVCWWAGPLPESAYKAMLVELKKRAPLQYDTPYGPVSF